MIRYEVSLGVDPGLAAAVEEYMVGRHIPDVLATGCFVGARFDRAESGSFRTTYLAGSQEILDGYLASHAPRLRGDFLEHFPEGVTVSREVWTEIAAWEGP